MHRMHRIYLETGGRRALGKSEAYQREFAGFQRSRRPDFPTTTPAGRPHPGARASRPHALPLGAAQFPCDAAPGHPAGGYAMGWAEAESWRRCRSSQVEEMNQAVPSLVRAGRPRSRVGCIPRRRRSKGAPSLFVDSLYSFSFTALRRLNADSAWKAEVSPHISPGRWWRDEKELIFSTLIGSMERACG